MTTNALDILIGKGWNFPIEVDHRGGIRLVTATAEIEQSIQLILTTPIGQRLMRPEFGSRLHELVFASINTTTMSAAREYVQEALGMWEPRIDVEKVVVMPDPDVDGFLLITIHYRVRATHDARSLVYPFYSIPLER